MQASTTSRPRRAPITALTAAVCALVAMSSGLCEAGDERTARLRGGAREHPGTPQDIVVGAPAFDDAFVVQGWDPGSVRQALGPEVRAALCALAAGARVHVDDARLEILGLPLDDDVLVDALRQAVAVARALRSPAV